MEGFCGGNDSVGDTVRSDCRTDLFLVVVNCAFVLDCVCVFLWKIVKTWKPAKPADDGEIVFRFREHNTRWVLSFCYVIVTWCDIGDAIFFSQLSNQYRLSAFLPPCCALLAAIMSLIYYNKLEFWKLYKPLLLLLVFWAACFLLRAIKLVQLYNMGFGVQHLCVDVSWAYLVIYFMLMVVELNLLCSQRYILSRETRSTEAQYNVSGMKYVYNSSNVISKCVFWWMTPVLWAGYKHPLELQDLGLLPQPDHVERQFERFNEIYLQEKEKAEMSGKPISVWRCFWKFCWPMMTLSGVFKLLSDLVGYIGPLSIGIIIKFVNTKLDPPTNTEKVPSENEFGDALTIWEFLQNGYVMAGIVLLATVAQSTFVHTSIQLVIMESIHLRACIQTLIYNKCLRMSTWQASGSVDVGVIINHVSSDAFNLMMLFMMGHFIWAIPLQITVLLVLLTLQLGYSALIGAAAVALFIPLQFLISKYMSKLQKKILAASDWRLKKTSELLDGMKLLKLHAWEKLFGEEIHTIREKELKLLLKDAMCWSSNSFLTQVSSIVLALVTFAVYSTVEGKSLTPEEVFTSLALFGQLAVPLFLFPIVVPIVISAVVSARRLTSFLSLSDVNHSTIKHIDAEGSTILEFEADSGSIVLHIKEHKPDKKQNSFRDSEVFLCDSDDDLDGDRNVAVELKNASFTWDAVNKEPMLHNVTSQFPAGNLTIVVGSVGSGKTSLLSALLGEMCMLEGTVKWSRNSPVGYVPQKPWLINASLRDNILFGQAYDARRFSRVIAACALQVDIDLLPGGEQTEIGEKGVNLSGGQKQRIAIARALYSRCKTLLLDDPFSALDAQVGLHVFEEGVKKLLLRYKRTVILVTHRLQFLTQASKIVFMENGFVKHQGSFSDIESCNTELCNRWKATMNREEKESKQDRAGEGTAQERQKLVRLLSQRSTSVVEDVHSRGRAYLMQRQMSCDTSHPFPVHDYSEHLSNSSLDHSLLSIKSQKLGYEENCEDGSRQLKRMISMKSTISHEVPEEAEEHSEDDKEVDETAVQLISKEERARGSVSSKVFLSYARACGWPFCVLVLFAAISTQATNLGKDFWLSAWSSESKKEKDSALPGDEFTDEVLKFYLPVYATLSVLAIILSLCTNIAGAFAGLRAQRRLHSSMLDSIIQAPMRFFDTNPAGRILNRFSGDIGVLDKKVAMTIQLFLRFVLLCLSAVIVNIVVSVYFLIVVVPIFIVYYLVQKFFRCSSRELQRMDSITKSPIYSHFSETVSGLTTIRAFRDEARFKEKFASTINTNNLVFLFITAANRWLGIALDYLGGIVVFVATVAAITAALYGAIPPGFVGLAMAYSLLIPIYLNWVVRHAADTEMYMSGVERIGQYVNINTEEYSGNKEPPEEWPFSGEIRMENASLRYDVGLQPVLSKVSLNIKPGEKVGICGRTGSGKSSLTLGLFRMIEIFEGYIYVDDVDITKVPLTTLRSRLAIIPQEAVMFTGSLRLNLDPEGGHTENELWDALEKAQLKDVLQNMSQGLDTEVSQGDNFSIGQRQLFCLARAILRKSKVVVMDEATASLDSDTDRVVQKVMTEAFADCTVLTIAHRISTILHYDKIVVLDAGNIVEFGPPSELLKKSGSIFLSLVKANK